MLLGSEKDKEQAFGYAQTWHILTGVSKQEVREEGRKRMSAGN